MKLYPRSLTKYASMPIIITFTCPKTCWKKTVTTKIKCCLYFFYKNVHLILIYGSIQLKKVPNLVIFPERGDPGPVNSDFRFEICGNIFLRRIFRPHFYLPFSVTQGVKLVTEMSVTLHFFSIDVIPEWRVYPVLRRKGKRSWIIW